MSTPRTDGRRLTGNQYVSIVLAVCAALVLTPVGVYAAATQRVVIADADRPRRTVDVDANGRIAAAVAGSVRTVPRPPAEPFHRGQLVAATTPTLGARIPAGKGLAITSISTVFLPGMTTSNGQDGLRIVIRQATAAGGCPATGAVLGVALHHFPDFSGAPQSVDRVFPAPQVWAATEDGLCVQVDAGVAGFPVVVDGYLF